MPSFSVTPPPQPPPAALHQKMFGVMGGPMQRDLRPALTKAQMFRPGIGLKLGMDHQFPSPPKVKPGV